MKKITLIILTIFTTLISCSKDDNPGPQPSSENKILTFNIIDGNNTFNGIINQNTKSITVTTNGLDLSIPLTPSITISENATISPSLTSSQVFNQPVEYTVTAENGDSETYTVSVVSSDSRILSFSITPFDTAIQGDINETNKTISIETVGLESNSILIPNIEISPNATITPSASIQQDFSQPIDYTVTAQDGSQSTYTVTTNNTSFSSEKKILTFNFNIDGELFEGDIDHNTLEIRISTYKDITSIIPEVTISENATITPASDIAQDFSQDIQYVVTAQDQTSNTYTVKTFQHVINNFVQKSYIRAFSRCTIYLTNENDINNAELYLENDSNSYQLNINDLITQFNPNLQMYGNYFSFEFTENIVTATNYKLRLKINGITIAESFQNIDVLAENAPHILSANQTLYNLNDTLILTGVNLLPQLRILAPNGSIYQINDSYLSVNPEATELNFPMTNHDQLFPSYFGDDSPRATRVDIYYNDRYADYIILDFL